MKTFKSSFTFLFAALFAVMSCVKETPKTAVPESGQPQLKSTTFCAVLGYNDLTRTTASAGKVCWESSDKVTLFSGEGFASKTELSVDYLAEGGRTAIFSGLADENSASYLAVYPYSESYAYDAASSVLTVEIPSAQTAVAGSFGSGANVSVALSSDKNLNFRNVGALVGMSLLHAETANTSAIVLKAKGTDGQYKKIAGTTEVTIDERTGVPAVSGATSEAVTLYAPQGGFVENTIYYFAVLPGEYSAFELSLLDAEGRDKARKTYGDGEDYVLERSTMIAFEAKLPPLPDEFEITLDFEKGWPFEEPITAAADQTSAGEYYNYMYENPNAPDIPVALAFGIQKGQNRKNEQTIGGVEVSVNSVHTYSCTEGALSFDSSCDVDGAAPAAGGGGTWGLVGIPGIEDRYVTKVTVHYNGIKYFTFADGSSFVYGANPNANQPDAERGKNPAVFNLPYGSKGQVAAVAGRSYILRLRGAGFKISKIVVNYSKNKPQ